MVSWVTIAFGPSTAKLELWWKINEEDDDGDNNLLDWAWVHEAGGFQDEPMDEDEANIAQEEPPDELG